jgi:hypothetical protein
MNFKKEIVFYVLTLSFTQYNMAQQITDFRLFKTIAKVITYHKNSPHIFKKEQIIAQNAYDVFHSKSQKQELQVACMYGIIAQIEQGRQKHRFIYPAKALSCLAHYPIQDLWRPYVIASQAINEHKTPWVYPRTVQATEKFKDH